ncbi:hypothetical protein [Nocardioides sp.]|uniref:hypothetical protein n=1 Tax=Nocardioides sp. TaxID=35761 RepID=UPI0035665FC8
MTNYGYKGTAVGAKLYVNNAQVLSAKDAVAPLRCTRMAGRTSQDRSVLSTPENSLISLSTSTSKTVSYKNKGVSGVRATNVLGDVVVGGTLPGRDESTPLVTIKGLETVANAFHTKDGFGHEESFAAPEFDIDVSVLIDNGVPIPKELNTLLDAIEDAGGQLTTAVVDVLANVPAPIEIPNLGSIGLGIQKGHANKRGAESDVKALELKVTATGEDQVLQLGHARAVISGPAKGGVFRSTSMPLDAKIADGLLHFGGVRPRTIPCAGTNGKVKNKHLNSASVLLPRDMIVGATDIDYSYMGEQLGKNRAKGVNASSIGAVSIKSLDLKIEGIASKVITKSKTNRKGKTVIRSVPRFSIATITFEGNNIAIPTPGKPVTIDGLGILESRIVEGNRWGKRVTALRVTLTDYSAVLDLGISASQIFAY